MNNRFDFKLVLIYLFGASLIFTILVPPFQKPDEYIHFRKALAISRGVLKCSKAPPNNILISQQSSLLLNNRRLNKLIAKKNNKMTLNYYLNLLTTKNNNKRLVKHNIDQTCPLSPIPYLPYAGGLLLGRLTGANAYQAFILGRYINFVVLFAWFLCLIKYIPQRFKSIALLTFSLPMAIHQITAYSYDGFQIMIGLSIFTVFTNFLKNRKNRLFKITLLLGLFAVFVLSRGVVKTAYPGGVDAYAQFQAMLADPILLALIILKTTIFKTLFYIQGAIGIFGWLEYGLQIPVYLLFSFIILGLILNTDVPPKNYPLWIIPFLIIAITAYYTLVLFINLLYWSPLNTTIIEGVQGRYFLPILPFILLVLVFIRGAYLPKLPKLKINLTPQLKYIILGLLLSSILVSVYSRFYSLS